VLATFSGIVIQMLIDRTYGTHFHAIYGESELVIGLNPLRVIQGEAPSWVAEWSLDWVKQHQSKLNSTWNLDLSLATPLSRQASAHLAFENSALRHCPTPQKQSKSMGTGNASRSSPMAGRSPIG